VAAVTKSPGVMVWIWLLYLAWDNGMRPVPLANVKLKRWGVNRETKRRVLDALEKAGLIVIERRPRKAPVVTLTLL
jgi:DNA-binding MarR family transcriptional regulator